jgi:alkaline phosphatase D
MRPISRRTFLAASVVVPIAAGLAACSGGDEDASGTTTSASPGASDTPSSSVGSPATTAAAPSTEPATTMLQPPPADLSGDPFTLGVASGDPSPSAVVLWTRLAPDPFAGGGMPDTDVEVLWEVAADDSFNEVRSAGLVTALARHGHSVHVAVEVADGERIFYRFRVGEWTSPAGRAWGTPSESTSLRFASASCQNYDAGFYTAHADIAAQDLDLVVFLGDYIYEGSQDPVDGVEIVRSMELPEAVSLTEYRNRYGLYKSDPLLQSAHASCPWFVTWDDHEVENNYAALIAQDPSDGIDFAQRRRDAYQAWWEHMPVALPPPDGDDFRIYRSLQWGDLAQVQLLDGRQYRSDQACDGGTLNLDPACEETFDPERTMLGQEQEDWLIDGLGASSSTWNVIAQQTVFGDVTLGEAVLNYDQWDGYPVERNSIVDRLAADAIPNVVVLTGDIHFAGVGVIRSGGRGTGTPVGVELVATSISSGGLINPAVTDVVKAIPDIVDVELEHRGYILHTVTPDRWSAEYRMVETVKEPEAPMFVHAVYEVAVGTNLATIA